MPRKICPKKQGRKKIIFATFLASLFLLAPIPKISLAYTESYPYFVEDFNSTYSEHDKWNVDSPKGCHVTFSDQAIKLWAEGGSGRFPYITPTEPIFPEGDFSIEISFRFLNQMMGTGIAITDTEPPPIGTNWRRTHDNSLFFAWPLVGNQSGILTTLCPESDPDCLFDHRIISHGLIDSNTWETMKIDFAEGKYYLYVEGNPDPIFISASTDRVPKYVWLGSPQRHSGGWSPFEVDHIHIEELIDPATFESLLGEIELLHSEGKIKKAGVRNALIRRLENAQRLYEGDNLEPAINILQSAINFMNAQKGKAIAEETAEQLELLINSLLEGFG